MSVESNKLPFSKVRLERLPMPKGGRVYWYDERTPGLCLCITPNDVRTFYHYQKVRGRPIRVRLGRFPEMTVEQARALAVKTRASIADGHDPQAEKVTARQVGTLGALWEAWLNDYAKAHVRTWKEHDWKFNKFLAHWKTRQLSDLKRAEVQALHLKIGRENGEYMANRVLQLLKTLFNYASKTCDYHGENPGAGIERFPEVSRERFLLPAEVPQFFKALDADPDPTVQDYFRLAVLTGLRKSNLLALRWDEIGPDGTVRIPAIKVKSGRPLTVPLVPEAIQILEARRKRVPGEWVFPGRGGKGHQVEIRKAWLRVLKRAGLTGIRLHDLRRTTGSWLAAAGASTTIIGATLGHAAGSRATAVYARLDLTPIRQALGTATQALLKAANGSPTQKEGESNG